MSTKDQNFDLISMMVDETFNQVSDSNIAYLDDFRKESMGTDLEKETFLMAFDGSRSCYILQVGKETLEIPSNWGIFSKLQGHEGFKSLNKLEDSDFFMEILENLTGKSLVEIHFDTHPSYIKLELVSDGSTFGRSTAA